MLLMLGALFMHATKILGGLAGRGFAAAMLALLLVVLWLRRL